MRSCKIMYGQGRRRRPLPKSMRSESPCSTARSAVLFPVPLFPCATERADEWAFFCVVGLFLRGSYVLP